MLNKYVHMRTQTQAQCTEMKWNIAWLFWRLYFAVVCGAVPVWRVCLLYFRLCISATIGAFYPLNICKCRWILSTADEFQCLGISTRSFK